MKSSLKRFISIFIFVLILGLIFLLIRPLYIRVSNSLINLEEKYLKKFTELTSLTFSYESLSPSVFSGIRVKNIKLYALSLDLDSENQGENPQNQQTLENQQKTSSENQKNQRKSSALQKLSENQSESKQEILSIKKLYIRYNLFKIIKGDFENAFSRLLISDITFNINQELIDSISQTINEQLKNPQNKNQQTLENQGENQQNQNFSSEQEGETNENNFDLNKTLRSLRDFAFNLPFDVNLRNIKAEYSNKNDSFFVMLRELNFQKDKINQSLSSDLNGIFNAKLDFLGGKTFGTRFRIDGNLSNLASGASLRLFFDDYSRSDFSLKHFENLLVYQNSSLELRSVQQDNNYNLFVRYEKNPSLLSAELYLNDLDPFTLIRGTSYPQIILDIMGTKISGKSNFSFDFSDFKYKWNTNNSLELSKKISPLGQKLSFNLSGDNDFVNVNSLNARGELASFTFNGRFDIKNLIPQAYMNLEYYKIPNGNKISGELYVQPNREGFICFVPQLNLGKQSFSALELSVDKIASSMNFTFDGFDYTHSEYEKPASVHLDGSLSLENSSQLQTSVSVDSLFLDSIARSSFFFLESDDVENSLVKTLNPFITSFELYLDTDFKNFTFNSPYLLFANTQVDRQVLFLSVDGSENAINLSQCDLIFDKNSLVLTANADISPEDGQVIFNSALTFNSIPYDFSGIYSDKWINLTGSYGFELSLDFKNGFVGSTHFDSLPVSYENFLFSLGTQIEFDYKNLEDFNVNIENFSLDELNGVLRTHPKFTMSASVDKNGFVASSINISDSLSVLSGTSYALWNVNNGIFDNMNLNLSLKNEISSESINLNGQITNPLQKSLNSQSIVQDFYFSLNADVNEFPMAFIFPDQQNDDSLSAIITATGTIENPYLAVNLLGLSYSMGGLPLTAQGNFNLLEGIFSIENLDGSWNGFYVSSSSANIDLSKMEGNLNTNLSWYLNSKSLVLPLQIKLENLDAKSSENQQIVIPENFILSFYCPQIEGNLIENQNHELNLQIIRSKGRFDFISDEYLGFYGDMTDDGFMNFAVAEDKSFHFNLNGSIINNEMNLALNNVYLDLSKFNSIINSDFFSVYKATLEGNLNISGLATDPNLEGFAVLNDVEINFPSFVPEHVFTSQIPIDFSQEEIVVPQTTFTIKDGKLDLSAVVELDRWALSALDVRLLTQKNKDIPVDIQVPFVRVKGFTSIDATLTMDEGSLDLLGDIGIRNSEISLLTNTGNSASFDSSESNSSSSSANSMNVNVGINLNVGQKVQIVLNPLIRGLIAPNTPISFNMDMASGLWNLKGDVVLRGGELSYLNRNFYLKEGRIILNETQNYFNPFITVRAETREHDENGDPITITVSAIRQNVSNFHATMYSTPAKSETELLTILGQMAAGDATSAGNFLLSTVDYGVSVTLIRRLEGALRDLFNFDIFSIRTSLLQNVLKQGFTINSDSEKATFGSNLFDNSTVYIGKYFGSSIYADALMHWSYDESKAGKSDETGGLVFQPEVGLELASPFANIRWSYAPDLGDFGSSWAAASSITLSWRFSF